MLSTENDPPCPHLKNTSDDDDRHSQNLSLSLPDVDRPPLLSNPLVASDTEPAKFSIRDYVLTARRKDTKTNWPFPLKHLQLCLHHNVKELLPPFQSSSTLRNQFFNARASRSTSDKGASSVDAKPSSSKNHSQLDPRDNSAPLNQQTEHCLIERVSCQPEGENEFPSKAKSASQSELKSVPTNRQSHSALESDTSLEVDGEVSASSHKSESTAQPPSTKSKLLVNFSTHTESNSPEYIASNSTAVSEVMASKVCPVCKTFSSSSNTTLNAHIDQCLTEESTQDCTVGSELTRQTIKHRKARLITDIYATAKLCTLEDLERRNGRICGPVPELPTENDNGSEISGLGNVPRISPLITEDKGDVGAVYVDDTGTKVRILCKSTDVPSMSKLEEGPLPRKPIRGVQGRKTISKEKKRNQLQKHNNNLNLVMQSKEVDSQKVHSSQVCNADGESADGIGNQIQNQANPSYFGVLKQWLCSKRTSRAKKVNNKVQCQFSSANQFVSQERVVSNTVSTGRNQSQEAATSVRNPIHGNESKDKTGTSLCAAKENPSFNQTSPQKTGTCPARLSRINDNVGTPSSMMKEKSSLSSKDGTTIHVDHVSSMGSSAISSSNKFVVFDGSSADDSDCACVTHTHLSSSSCEFTDNAPRFPSLKRSLLSVGSRSTTTLCETNLSRKSLCPMNLHVGLSDIQEKNVDVDSEEETMRAPEKDVDVEGSSNVSVGDNDKIMTHSMNPNYEMFCDDNVHKPFEKNDQPFMKVEGLIPANFRFTNEHEKTCPYGVDNGIIRQSKRMAEDLESELPIPIPGPPGSFLPSPGGADQEEFQGNSLSTLGQDNFNIEDSLASHISTTTTTSNFVAFMPGGRCHPHSADLRKEENGVRTVASGSTFEKSVGNRAAVPQTSASMERTEFEKNLNGTMFLGQQGSLRFGSEDDQTCCSESMVRLGQIISNDQEESQPLKRPTMSKMERQMHLGPKTTIWVSDGLSDAKFSLDSHVSTGSLNVSIPTINSIDGPEAGPTPSARANSDSISPSSNPTLRLMGKNLMVVNKDDVSVDPGLRRPSPSACYRSPQIPPIIATPPHSVRNQISSSYHTSFKNVVEGPENSMGGWPTMSLGRSMNIQPGMKAPQTSSVVPTRFLNQRKDVFENIGHYFINPRPNLLNNASTAAPLHNVERIPTVPECQNISAVSAPSAVKEFICIDDVAGSKKEIDSGIAHVRGDMREWHTFSYGILHSAATNVDPSYVNSLPGAWRWMHEANLNSRTPLNRVAAMSARRNCTPDGMGGLNQNHFFVAGSS